MAYALIVIKPDGVDRGLTGAVLDRYANRDFRIRDIFSTRLTLDEARELYIQHKDTEHFDALAEFTASGTIIVVNLWRNGGAEDTVQLARTIAGPAVNPAPGTIRGDFAESVRHNIVHVSDSPEAFAREYTLLCRAKATHGLTLLGAVSAGTSWQKS